MKTPKITSLKFITLILLSLAANIHAEEKMIIAYLKEGLAELNKSEKLVALQMWSDDFASQNHRVAEVRGIDSLAELMQAIQLKQVDLALLNTGEFLLEYPQLKPYMAPEIYAVERTEGLYEDYLIVVKKSSSIKTIADLNRKRFSYTSEHVSFNHYLEYLTLHTNGQKPAQYFKQIRNSPTASQSVLDVFFGNSDACLIPRHVYMMTASLNPEILQQLTVIHSSGPIFIPAVVLAFNYTSENDRATYGKFLTETHNTVRGQQIFDLFKIMRIVQVNYTHFQPMFAFYE